MADAPKKAAAPAQKSGGTASKPAPGRPFVKDDPRINRGGRPASREWRGFCRAGARVFLAELFRKAAQGALSGTELREAMVDVARLGGYLTEPEEAQLEATRLEALAHVLKIEQLSPEQRSRIIDDFQKRLQTINEAPAPELE